MSDKRGKVWLAVSGLLKSPEGHWLVVKKRYGGLKGKWSLPGGFVEPGETVDEAVIREVKEETGIDCTVKGFIGMRTGVIKGEVSDNLAIFLLESSEIGQITHQESELYDAQFIAPEELLATVDSSVLLRYLLQQKEPISKPCDDGINPGDHFGYTSYRVFL